MQILCDFISVFQISIGCSSNFVFLPLYLSTFSFLVSSQIRFILCEVQVYPCAITYMYVCH